MEYAKRSTAYAQAAMEAATRADNAVKKALQVEKAAREAEAARIAADTELGVLEARLRAKAESDDAERAEKQRAQADRATQRVKDLIAAAEAALRAGDTAKAVASGRQAAVGLLESSGTWTREAAEFALAGTDQDTVNWIDTDRLLAQQQDDREAVLTIATSSTADVAEAAHKVLAGDSPEAVRDFLDRGVLEAAATDNRVALFRILNENPGRAVKEKAEAALKDGSAQALHRFLTEELAEAVKEDDNVEVFRLLGSGGPYMQSAAKIVLEGSARMRRGFVSHDQYNIARLDHDRATHVAAIQSSIALAAKVAAEALENAARASKAAAEARDAAAEATDWAHKADAYAQSATDSATEARRNADAADKSAAAAAQSAKEASKAAVTARGAARAANFSMRQASASAQQAVASAWQAQASASRAQASANQAGKDAKAAATAASEARRIVVVKRKAEAEAAAKRAAEKAKEHQSNGTNPSQTSDNDKPWYVEHGVWPEDVKSAKDWAQVTGHWSTIAGGAAVVLGVGSFFFPPLGGAALAVGLVSWGLQGASALLNYIGNGPDSSEFHSALGMFAVGGILLGTGQLLSKFGKMPAFGPAVEEVGEKIANVAHDITTTVAGWLTW